MKKMMGKIKLAILMLGIICAITACKSKAADQGGNAGSASESSSYERMETHDNLSIKIEEGQSGAVSPD